MILLYVDFIAMVSYNIWLQEKLLFLPNDCQKKYKIIYKHFKEKHGKKKLQALTLSFRRSKTWVKDEWKA